MEGKEYLKGRGAQYNPHNKFVHDVYGKFHHEGIDSYDEESNRTIFIPSEAKSLVHKVESPDVGMEFSANPYQGCEHGCIYCYARNSHQYWALGSGLDFERKIIVKSNAIELFEHFVSRKNWNFTPIHLSGNTDCYQPIERKMELTREILKIAIQYKQPISIITKNALILRDKDILADLAKLGLVKIFISINSLTEETRQKIEPRTVTAKQRLRVIEELAYCNIPMGVNVAPIIPGLTDTEIPSVLKSAADAGAQWANYIIVRLNGQIGEIFKDWLTMAYPERSAKIWNSILSCHNGQVNNSNFSERMKGSGKVASIIRDIFKLHCVKNKLNMKAFEFADIERHSNNTVQLKLF
ncbi:PA0069 family radical SAM protein [Sphingobacterium bovistauri]|uniref:PA0069 family radical SAM protein n=1 Tax=Sphingobacterium bovistauri TaxID=2781959 RepID=A0ABS7Z5N1_9SPHI|nr:PA0069 family radical SAM protein [Sphingobacterium bovistauri]MCA5005496.1 PA0069 family radical SAM protein [Sphingobacterium bovistauri]